MKKTIIALAITGIAALQSCKEIGPAIILTENESEDTTYMAPVEQPQLRNVVIEDFTGVSCPPCPAAQEDIKAYEAKYPGRVLTIGYHIFNFPQANPVKEGEHVLSVQDFRTQVATDIGNSVFGGISAMPIASVDRTPVGSDLLLSRPQWNLIDTRINVESPVNMYIKSKYDAASRTATITTTVAVTKTLTHPVNLYVGLLENDIVSAQKKGLTIDTFYNHRHVLRDVITPYSGLPLFKGAAQTEAGTVYVKTYKYTLTEEQAALWKTQNMLAYAFVCNSDGTNKEIAQAVETHLEE